MSSSTLSALLPSALSIAGGVDEGMAPLSLPSLIAALRAGTDAEITDILQALGLGAAKSKKAEKAVAAAEKPKKAAGRPKKAVAAPAALPEAEDGAPDASAYRLDAADIDESTCMARSLDGGEDKRWAPTVYREKQCGKDVVEGSDLCATCTARLARFAEDPKGMRSKWFARVTEEPPSFAHMLGTQWAADKPPKWRGSAEAASDTASDSGSEKQMSVASAPKKADKADKEAAAAAKKAEKEAAAAAKKEAKEIAAAEKKAVKEAEAALKKAEKAAEKAAKPKKEAAPKKEKADAKPKKEAAAKPKKAAAAGGAGAASVPAKADTGAAVVEVKGEMELIDGTMYWIRDGNVYEYDSMTETAGDFVGRLGADGESIDTEAAEVTGAESDSE